MDEELDAGHKAARDLCQHLRDMGAARLQAPVTVEGATYRVTVELIEQASEYSIDNEGALKQ